MLGVIKLTDEKGTTQRMVCPDQGVYYLEQQKLEIVSIRVNQKSWQRQIMGKDQDLYVLCFLVLAVCTLYL